MCFKRRRFCPYGMRAHNSSGYMLDSVFVSGVISSCETRLPATKTHAVGFTFARFRSQALFRCCCRSCHPCYWVGRPECRDPIVVRSRSVFTVVLGAFSLFTILSKACQEHKEEIVYPSNSSLSIFCCLSYWSTFLSFTKRYSNTCVLCNEKPTRIYNLAGILG